MISNIVKQARNGLELLKNKDYTLRTETLVRLPPLDSSSELKTLIKISSQLNSSNDDAISCFKHSNNGKASLNSLNT